MAREKYNFPVNFPDIVLPNFRWNENGMTNDKCTYFMLSNSV